MTSSTTSIRGAARAATAIVTQKGKLLRGLDESRQTFVH